MKNIESYKLYNQLIDQSKDPNWLIDSNFLLIYANQAYLNLMKELSGNELKLNAYVFEENIEEGYIQKWKGYYDRAMSGESFEIEDELYYIKSKVPTYFIISFTPIFGENKEIIAIACHSKDSKDIRHTSKLLSSVITNTNDAVLITEAEPFDEPGNRIIYVNEAFTKMTGYTSEEVIGKTPRILQGPNSNKEDLAEIGRKLRNWEACELTTINYKKNGEEFWINFSLTPVADEKGWYTHWIAIERDVTEQKNKELQNELLDTISLNFRIEKNLTSSTKAVCQSISEYGKFDFVEIWLPNMENNLLRLISVNSATSNAEKFYKKCKAITSFQMDEGLPGKVWKEKVFIQWDELSKKEEFIRKDAAKKTGIQSVLGIPLFFNQKVVGVLVIGTSQEANYLKNYIKLFDELIDYIGSELNRKKLENDLIHLHESIPDIVCIIDFQRRFLKMNKAGLDVFGYSEDELLYHSCEKFIHPDDREIFIQQISKFKQGNSALKFENRYLTKSGDILWLSWICNLSINEELIYATAKNITDEKRLSELNRQVGLMAKIGSWEVDIKTMNTYFSEQTYKIYDLPQGNPPNIEDGISFYAKEARPIIINAVNEAIEKHKDYNLELPFITAKRKKIWIRTSGKVEVVDGKAIRLYGAIQDITEEKLATLKLEKSLKELKDYKFTLDQSAIIAFTDGKGVITSVNDNFCKISGYSRNEIIGQTHRLINSKYHPKSFFKDLWKTISSGNVWRGEIKNKSKDGTYYWVYTTIVPFLNEKNKPYQYLAIRFDITESKKAEVEIIDSEEKRKLIMNGALDAIVSIDTNERIIFWNPQAEIIFGWKEDEVMGKPLSEMIIPKLFRKSHVGGIKNYLKTGQGKALNVLLELSAIDKNENEFPIELTIIPIKQGEDEFFCAFIRDITQRKKAQKELISALEEKNSILERITEAFIALDTNWCFTYVNKKAGEIFNRDPKIIIGENIWTVFPKETNHPFKLAYERAMKSQKYTLIEELYTPYDLWLENHIYPSPKGISIFFRDVTERKRNEEKLQKSNDRFEKVTQATSDTIWDWDIVNDSFYRSKNAHKFFGKTLSTKLSANDFWNDTFLPNDLDKVKLSLSVAMEDPTENHWEAEYRIYNKTGKHIHVNDRGLIIRDSTGKAVRMIGAMSDITKSKEQEQELLSLNESLKNYAKELERSNEELDQFAFITSHDLQEPLRMISSFMDQLYRKYGDQLDEKALQYIYFAIDGAKRMKQIILDLLDYSRAGKPTDSMEQININEILSDFKQLRRKIISEKSVRIITNELPTIYSYKVVITQILHSLLDNAIKYSKEGVAPIIELTTTENKGEWKFAIKDNGIGIDAKFFDKIFIIFQRLHNRDEYDGTGIGLSIAKRHIEFLGGRIWLESNLGEGSIFYFVIPKS